MNITITMRIREERKARGLTLVELAKISGVSKSHISEIETGKQLPTLQVLCLLAESLEVSPERLYRYSIKK